MLFSLSLSLSLCVCVCVDVSFSVCLFHFYSVLSFYFFFSLTWPFVLVSFFLSLSLSLSHPHDDLLSESLTVFSPSRSPFFTVYLVRAFCSDSCIPPLLMSVFTWLGYLNSAVNPIIYGLFSRDFRREFKQIVCKCSCTPTHDTGVSSLIRNIHMSTFLDEEAAK